MRIFAEINGKRILCLIDTGAHVSLISKKTAKSCKIKSLYQPDFGGVYGIGNNMVPLVGQADIKIKLANCEVNSKIMIIDQKVTRGPYEAILGRETLKDLPLCLNFLNWELINIDEIKALNKIRESSVTKNEQINTLKHNTYTKTPAHKFIGRQINSKIDSVNFLPKKNSDENNLHQKNVEETNNARNSKKFFNVGDLVWIREHTGHVNWSRGTIVHEKGEYKYGVKIENNSIRIAHADQLRSRKPYELRSRTHTLIEKT
uniref:Peptidase A2 domain-containing protein n=1 Tax=Meloidogyne enterolobii TaxID=390850 RepID=A0A6V7XVR0_MELEN|nr:unnamed protein product [Meloidogyne enterolobii]